MEAFLNRLRGSKNKIFGISGKLIYSLYFGLLFGIITQWYIGILVFIGHTIGSRQGFGKWVGALCYPQNINLEKAYQDKEGQSFPFIHQIANFFIKEKEDYLEYCELALFIRGFIWGLCTYISLLFGTDIINLFLYICNFQLLQDIKYISLLELFIVSLVYGIGFPLACWLSTVKEFTFTNKHLSINGRWETQEVYFGFIHFISNLYIIFVIIK